MSKTKYRIAFWNIHKDDFIQPGAIRYETWSDAHEALLIQARLDKSRAKQKLEIAQNRLTEVVNMKEPEGTQ